MGITKILQQKNCMIEIEEIEIIKDSLGDYIGKDYLDGIEMIKEFLEKKLFFI